MPKWPIGRYFSENNRRNLTDSQKRYFIGKRYEEENKGHGGNREVASGNSYHLKTSEIIAKERMYEGKEIDPSKKSDKGRTNKEYKKI